MNDLIRDFVRKFRGWSQRFIMIFKKGDVIKIILSDEILEFLYVLLRFSGESNDEVGANKVDRELRFDKI